MTDKAVEKILTNFEKVAKQLVKSMNMLADLELTHDVTKQVKQRKKRVVQDTQAAPVVKAATKKVAKKKKRMGRPKKSAA